MKPFYFLFLSVVVAMGQTTLNITKDQEQCAKNHGIFEAHFEGSSQVSSCTGPEYIRFDNCYDVITFHGHSKTIKELFSSECGLKADPNYHYHPGSPGAPWCRIDDGTAPKCETTEPMIAVPKLESAEPPKCYGNDEKGKEREMPCGAGGDPAYEVWQAIADHCHIETLVHHRSAKDNMFGPGFDAPLPSEPQPDTWESVTGMRIVCK